MPTPSQVEQARRALGRLASSAKADWGRVWSGLRASDRVLMTKALAENWVGIAGRYGEMSAALGADLFEVRAADLGIRPKVRMAEAVNERQAMGNLGYSLSTAQQLGSTLIALDRLVLQPYRDTLQESAWASGAAWARVPSGAQPCAFCLMLASRGAVYRSAETAGDGSEYHGDCRCVPELVRDESDYPAGYDPDGLYEQYQAGRSAAGSGDTSAILSAIRQQSGIH